MTISVYQVDAFANKVFEGNPAAVCPLQNWLDDKTLQNIASENNLSETAFVIETKNGYQIRWFTPDGEVRFCGHATLAAAHVYFNHLNHSNNQITFNSQSGHLNVEKKSDGYKMNLPSDQLKEVELPELLKVALDIDESPCFLGIDDVMVVLDSQEKLENIDPDFRMLKEVDSRGVIVTAKGDEYDFVSRCFYPSYGIDEDPVTGSAHTTLTPYWSLRLDKKELTARQISKRGGNLRCIYKEDRVELLGSAVTFMEGKITLQ